MALMVFITFRTYILPTEYNSAYRQNEIGLISSKTPFTILPSKYSIEVPWNVTIINGPKCQNVPLIYLIKTSPYNFELRQLSRLMLKKQGGVTAFFVIGLRDSSLHSSAYEKLLQEEIENNKDFIVGNIIDSYRNLTLKTLTSYTYFTQFCNPDKTKWIILNDDDTFVDQFKVDQLLPKLNPDSWSPYCLEDKIRSNTVVTRDTSYFRRFFYPNSWKKELITLDEYDQPYYPTYCGGQCCLISSSYLLKTKEKADVTNPLGFTIEDVFFTGVLRLLAGLDNPITVPDICIHFNDKDKILKLSARINKLE